MPLKPRHASVFLLICLVIFFVYNPSKVQNLFLAPAKTMSITHTVLFQFKADAKPDDITAACARFLSLKDTCIHPTTQSTYIASLKGGKDNSPEGLQNGITHGFVLEFANAEDRDYYVKDDPTHQAFVKSVGGLIEKAVVVDFANGVY